VVISANLTLEQKLLKGFNIKSVDSIRHCFQFTVTVISCHECYQFYGEFCISSCSTPLYSWCQKQGTLVHTSCSRLL
jgi:hypothetical protein